MGLIFNDKSKTRTPPPLHPPTHPPTPLHIQTPTGFFTICNESCLNSWLFVHSYLWSGVVLDYVSIPILCLIYYLIIHTTDPLLPSMMTQVYLILSYVRLYHCHPLSILNYNIHCKKVCTLTPNLVEDELSLTLVQSFNCFKIYFLFDGSVPKNNYNNNR